MSHHDHTHFGLSESGLLDRRSLLRVMAAGAAVATVGADLLNVPAANAAAWHER